MARLPGPAYAGYWQALNADYGRAMPPLLLTAVVALGVVAVLSWGRGGLVLGIGVAALVLVIGTVVLTLAGLEPLNRIADAWDPAHLPDGWEESRRRWSVLHLVRTVLAVAAFACLVAAQAVDSARTGGAAPEGRGAAPVAGEVRPTAG